MKTLEGKTIIVTGASKGLGREIAKILAMHKANLVIAARDESQLKQLENFLKQYTSVLAVKTDITKEKDVQNLVKKTIDRFQKIDVLINNAGIYSKGSLEKISMNEWDKVIKTNLTGTFLCSKEVVKYMIQQKQGSIINISSVAGKVASKYTSAYCASKFGVIGFSKSIAKDLKGHNIKVTVICPSAINTGLFGKYGSHVPKSLMLAPEKVAEVIYKVIIGKKKKQVINVVKFRRVLYYLIRKIF